MAIWEYTSDTYGNEPFLFSHISDLEEMCEECFPGEEISFRERIGMNDIVDQDDEVVARIFSADSIAELDGNHRLLQQYAQQLNGIMEDAMKAKNEDLHIEALSLRNQILRSIK